MEKKWGRCCVCGRDAIMANRTRCMCSECNYRRLHDGKSRVEVARAKAKKPFARKKTGELAVFREIWSERPHICVRCGVSLGDTLKVGHFSHIKSKGARPDLRLDKTNIELLCMACHHEYEFGKRK